MSYLLGIDVGTSGAKVLLIDEAGRTVASAIENYPLMTPRPLWAEQNPDDWWQAVCRGITRVLSEASTNDIAAIGLTGQMHGLVMLDENGAVLRPAILWCDQRTQAQCEEIEKLVGRETIVSETCNPVLTGFQAPKILWVRQHEPEIYARACHFLLPKDYIRYKLTGDFATDVSDASGTSLLNVPQRAYSSRVLSALNIEEEKLPRVYESTETTGAIHESGAAATGLPMGTAVVAGASDNAASAIGNGIVKSGVISISIGTSGVVFAHLDAPQVDAALRVHTFCHAIPGKWHVMGVMLAAGGSLRWYRDTMATPEMRVAELSATDAYELIDKQAMTVAPGSEGLFFLPYLSGERTPHPDPLARGAFIGLTVRHNRAHMARAVMEGVAFGLRDSIEILKGMNISIGNVRISGGGAHSTLWRQIIADVLNFPLSVVNAEEGPALGAALLAGVGVGVYESVEEACSSGVKVSGNTSVIPENAALYEKSYAIYRNLYPALRPAFQSIGAES